MYTDVHTCTHLHTCLRARSARVSHDKTGKGQSPVISTFVQVCVSVCVCPSQQCRTILNSFMFLFFASSLIFYFQLYKRSKESFVEGKTMWFSIIFYLILWPRTAAKIIAFKSALNKCNPSPAIIPQLQHQLFLPLVIIKILINNYN